jgi:hypothetical protein
MTYPLSIPHYGSNKDYVLINWAVIILFFEVSSLILIQ